ncbi:MAG TPA: four helix bundle protein [Patescibacteria group bacterium]
MVNKFELLPIFKSAHALVLEIYKLTAVFPQEEKYGLVSQLRRSAASVVANIVEGNARGHRKEFLEFLYIAKGSLEETNYHLLLAKDLGYLKEELYKDMISKSQEVGKQIVGLTKYWKAQEK